MNFIISSILFYSLHELSSLTDSNELLIKLFEQYDEFNLRNNPVSATYEGDHRWDDRLDDLSENAVIAYMIVSGI
jgi:hypothetical protein